MPTKPTPPTPPTPSNPAHTTPHTLAEQKVIVADIQRSLWGTAPEKIVGILKCYIRRYSLPAAVARFPDDTITVIWQVK